MQLPQKHHAILFEGDRTAGIAVAHLYVTEVIGIAVTQNPDVRTETHDRITVEIAATLKARAQQRPFGSAQAFVVGCETIMIEAQNALLKLLEEPAENTHFIFILPSRELLLPTVLSRMLYAGRVEAAESSWEKAEEFLQAGPKERGALLAPIIKDKDRPAAQALVRLLGQYLHAQGVENHAHALREIAFVERYLNNRSSSIKMLLEHLSATL